MLCVNATFGRRAWSLALGTTKSAWAHTTTACRRRCFIRRGPCRRRHHPFFPPRRGRARPRVPPSPVRSPARPSAVVGREKYCTRFRESLRPFHHTGRPRYGGHPPQCGGSNSLPFRVLWAREAVAVAATVGWNDRARDWQGHAAAVAAGRRAGGTPPSGDGLGVRARSIRETIPLSPPFSPSSIAHTHTRARVRQPTVDRRRLSPRFTFFFPLIFIYFVYSLRLFSPRRID